uniref:Retrovirus-related Pol polyprotein from transposon TNT 1-94 n=1 Tax=Tanacetum cinerariifolium TaxID=118510 RepID=A0A6L2LWW2_TANCI|nr:retrovirus-related Pol polyprotein from transposon TNT 1-94 [Tanacetum cinerariifolium]
MIPEPGDAKSDINVTETFHLQTDDELSDKELKQIKADDQAIQTILLGLPEDIYAAVDSQDRQMHMVGGNGRYQFRQYAGQNARNPAGDNDVIGNQVNENAVQNPRVENTELLIAQKEEAGIQLQAEEYDLIAAVADLDEIEEVNTNCILMANLHQASTSGTQTDSALVYDTDESAEVHENYDDNEIFNMFTQEEQYIELLEPIHESHQVPHNDNDVIYEDTSVKQAKFVEDFKSLANEADASLAKNKALELEIECLLKAVVSQDIIIIVKNESIVDTTDLQTELKHTKERFENSYNDMQQKIERLQAQLGYLKGKSKDTSSVSDTRNLLSQKLKNKNVELEFQVLNYARENAHLKATYKNLFDSISLFKKVSDQKDKTQVTSANTKFVKQPIEENLSKVGKTNALSNPVTSNSVFTPQKPKSVNNDMVIAAGIFRINPSKTSREAKKVPNTVRASNKIKPITVSQPHVINKKDVNSDLNGLSSTVVDNTKTRRPQLKSNTKIDRVPSASKRQFCDSDLEVAFRRDDCFVKNLEGVDLLKGARSTNLYTIIIHEMVSTSLIFLMARASSTKSWLWHQRLSHLNYDTINDLARNDLVAGLPKFRYHKEHLCPSCEKGKSKRASHPPKPVPNSRQRLHLIHIDLCGPMRIASINGKRSKLRLQSMTSGHISSGLDLTYAPSINTTQQPSEGELDLLFEAMYDDYIGGQPSTTARTVPPAQEPQDVDKLNRNAMVDGNMFDNPFANPSTSAATASSSQQNVDPSNMHMFYQPYPHEFQWTKDHPLEQVIGEPS